MGEREEKKAKKEERISGLGTGLTHLSVAFKGAHLVFNHRAIFLAITEPLFQTHLDRVSGIFVSAIWGRKAQVVEVSLSIREGIRFLGSTHKVYCFIFSVLLYYLYHWMRSLLRVGVKALSILQMRKL